MTTFVNRIQNLSIRSKVTMAFAFVLALTVALGVFAVQRLAEVNDHAAEIRDNWLPSTRALGDFSFHTMRVRQIEAAALLAKTPDQVAKEAATLKAVEADAAKAWTSYDALVTAGPERTMADQVKAGWQSYLGLDQKMIELIGAGDKDAAHVSYVGNMRSTYNGWRDLVVKNIDLQIHEGIKASHDGEQAYLSARLWIYGALGLAAVLCAFAGTMIVVSVSRPVTRITEVTRKLAEGDLEVEVAGVERKDEVGTLAQALQVFKENAQAARALEVERDRQRAEQQRVAERITELTKQFDGKVTGALQVLSSASTELQATATSMSSTAEETSRQSTAIAAAADETSANVQTVASASEELSASITEIGRHVSQSTAIATKAVEQATETKQVVTGLAESAQSIGQVVKLITDIASQTNLLALNATIEAARAGESGKGFAVVAAEVKNLANQTTRATDDIAQKVAEIQSATGAAVGAIETVGGVIGEINRIATAIAAAVEQQSAATLEISRNVQQAANGTNEVAGNINGLSQAAGNTGAAATQVHGSASELSRQAEQLRAEVDQFLADVKAA